MLISIINKSKIFDQVGNMIQKTIVFYASLAIFIIISLTSTLQIIAQYDGKRVTVDLETNDYIENTTKTYTISIGESINATITNVALEVSYTAHSQSQSNYHKNGVEIKIFKEGQLLDTALDEYDSQSSYGTPIPGYERNRIFDGLDISPGDTLNVEIRVYAGDYANYLSYLKVETIWDTPTIHTITADSGAGGVISPSGAVSVEYGSSQTFAIIPDDGYSISDFTIDGESVPIVTSFGSPQPLSVHCPYFPPNSPIPTV
ncbi:hypothetical protein MCHI_002493 [Candidatus Magnetoovum chiemensis]|nr:hypothetical protein MCHI_002493 [Candidatus Magnetoovum chiemensis]